MLRALIVDDHKIGRKILCNLLKKASCEVEEAESGMQCLELVQKTKYDLIFMDHLMPEMDGIETLHRMKELSPNLNETTPVIILTANAEEDARESYLAEGFDEYLAKPVEYATLEEVVRRVLVAHGAKVQMSGGDVPMSAEEEIYRQAVEGFQNLALKELAQLQGFADESHGKDMDVEGFRILIHRMKTSAAMVRAQQVATEAQELENAARIGDREAIRLQLPHFEADWIELHSALVPTEMGTTGTAHMEKERLFELLDTLEIAMKETDIDRGDAVIEELKEYAYSEREQEYLRQLSVAVLDLDEEQSLEMIQQWKKYLQ